MHQPRLGHDQNRNKAPYISDGQVRRNQKVHFSFAHVSQSVALTILLIASFLQPGITVTAFVIAVSALFITWGTFSLLA